MILPKIILFFNIQVFIVTHLFPFQTCCQLILAFIYTTHLTDSTYQWSYFYDSKSTFSLLYPKAKLEEILSATNTTNPDSMLSIIFSAGNTFPVKLASPDENPSKSIV